MRQVEAFQSQLKQLQETFLELQDTCHPLDKLTRAAEMRAYLRSLTALAERINDELYRHTPQKMLDRMLTLHRQMNLYDT